MVTNAHRSSTLDQFLGKTVEVEFKDGESVRGKLVWNDNTDAGLKPNMYALIAPPTSVSFYKTHVKKLNGTKI